MLNNTLQWTPETFESFRNAAAAFVQMMGTENTVDGHVCQSMADVQRIQQAPTPDDVIDVLKEYDTDDGAFLYFIRQYC